MRFTASEDFTDPHRQETLASPGTRRLVVELVKLSAKGPSNLAL